MRRTHLISSALVVSIVAALALGSAFALSGHDPSANVTTRPADIAQDADDDIDDGARPPKTDKAEAIAEEFGVDAGAVRRTVSRASAGARCTSCMRSPMRRASASMS